MARSPNSADTVTVTLSTTPQVRLFLELLVQRGTYGKNPAEAADRLLTRLMENPGAEDHIREAAAKVQEVFAAKRLVEANLGGIARGEDSV